MQFLNDTWDFSHTLLLTMITIALDTIQSHLCRSWGIFWPGCSLTTCTENDSHISTRSLAVAVIADRAANINLVPISHWRQHMWQVLHIAVWCHPYIVQWITYLSFFNVSFMKIYLNKCCHNINIFVTFCWTGHRISRSSCPANWWLQEQYRISVPAVKVQCWLAENHPSWYDVSWWEWELAVSSCNVAVQLQVQSWVCVVISLSCELGLWNMGFLL